LKKITKQQLYKRQTTLDEVGEAGQQKLLQTAVIVVGCGGLGSVAAVYLAASGIGNIHLIDFDKVDVSNLHRQVFYKIKDIGKSKAEVLAKHIKATSPFVKVSFSNKAISKDTVFQEIDTFDFVLDCTDSLPIKYLLNDACVLSGKPLIYGSLYKFDGYVSCFNVKLPDSTFSANLRDAFPEISKEAIPNCSEIGTLNAIVGVIGLMQANEILKLVTGIGKSLINQLLIYNSLENTQYKMKLKFDNTCHSERKRRISEIFKTENYDDVNCQIQDESLLISAIELRKVLDNFPLEGNKRKTKQTEIISVIEDISTQLPFEVAYKIPFSTFDNHPISFHQDKEYIVVCNRGILSYTITQRLKNRHPNLDVFSLEGGITNY
jgi:adenylyltransferase/sulfurtransferase